MLFPLASVAGIQQNLLAGPADGNRSGTVRAIIVTKYFLKFLSLVLREYLVSVS